VDALAAINMNDTRVITMPLKAILANFFSMPGCLTNLNIKSALHFVMHDRPSSLQIYIQHPISGSHLFSVALHCQQGRVKQENVHLNS
jgi:hypothetical protein